MDGLEWTVLLKWMIWGVRCQLGQSIWCGALHQVLGSRFLKTYQHVVWLWMEPQWYERHLLGPTTDHQSGGWKLTCSWICLAWFRSFSRWFLKSGDWSSSCPSKWTWVCVDRPGLCGCRIKWGSFWHLGLGQNPLTFPLSIAASAHGSKPWCSANIYSKNHYSIWGMWIYQLPIGTSSSWFLKVSNMFCSTGLLELQTLPLQSLEVSIGFSLKRWDCDLDHLGISWKFLEHLTASPRLHQGFTKASPRLHQGTKCSRYHSQSSTVPSGSLPKAKPRPSSSETRTSWKPLLSWRIILRSPEDEGSNESPNWFDWFGLFGPNWMPCSMFRTLRPHQCVMYIISQSSC